MPDYGDERRAVGPPGRGFTEPVRREPFRPNMRDVAGPVQIRPQEMLTDSRDYFQQGPTPVDIPMRSEMIRRPETSFQNFVNRGGGGGDPFDQRRLGLGPGNWQEQEFDPKDVYDTRRLGLGGGPLTYGDVYDKSRLGLGPGNWQEQEFDPFDPGNLGMDSGEYLSSRYGGGLDDVAGMNGDARGMLEGAGFDVAGGPGMQNVRTEGVLWKQAHANVAKEIGVSAGEVSGKASQGAIQREFQRLKDIFYGKKYPTGTGGGGIMRGLTRGNPLGLMMEMMPVEPGMELMNEMFNPEVQTI